jgi:hypothetical protein
VPVPAVAVTPVAAVTPVPGFPVFTGTVAAGVAAAGKVLAGCLALHHLDRDQR